MILAAIDGQVVIILLMALFGFISWLSGKLNPGEKKAPPSTPRAPTATPPRRAAADSEEERMRRFLEALGLPNDQPPVPKQPPMRPRTIPTIPAAPPPLVVPSKVPPLPPPVPQRSLDELAAPTLPVEKLVLPELATVGVAEFETVSSKISATPRILPAALEPAVARVSIHELLRSALASPQQLRSAFVLRELLGPPPGLRGS